MTATASQAVPRSVGRYVLFEEIARGGMATVHLGRLRGPAGFKRTVAIKRLHGEFARNPEFVTSFLGEAQLAARILHPNVVPVLDVVAEAGELFLVMDYVHGESLSNLLKASAAKFDMPTPAVIAQIVTGVLYGLHAAHEARSDRGVPLQIVHRDVSPQNILVGSEGVARVLDFGVAKAAHQVQPSTREGTVKGKLAYMPPEQLEFGGSELDRRVDVYATSVVLWEALTGRRLFDTTEIGPLVTKILTEPLKPPSTFVSGLPKGLDEIVMKGLQRKRDDRWATAMEMARALEKVIPPVPIGEVSDWVTRVVDESLRRRTDLISKTENLSVPPPGDLASAMPDSVQSVLRGSRPDLEEISGLQSIGDTAPIMVARDPRRIGPPTPAIPFQLDRESYAGAQLTGPHKRPEPYPGAQLTGPHQPPDEARLSDPPTTLPKSKTFTILVLISFVSLAIIGVVLIRNVLQTREREAARLQQAQSAQASARPGPVAASADPTPSADPTASPPASSSAEHAASASSLAAGSAQRPPLGSPTALSAPKSTATAKQKCNPPWTLDERGVRVLKRECL